MDSYFEDVVSHVSHVNNHIVPETTQLTIEELKAVQKSIQDCTFNPACFPKLHVVQPGQRCFRKIQVPDIGERQLLKVLYLDEAAMRNITKDQDVITSLKRLEDILLGNTTQLGFKHYAPYMNSNRDGHGTTFTTGLAKVGHWNPAPVVHSYKENAQQHGVNEYLRQLNEEAGRLAGIVMPAVMGTQFLNFSRRRQAAFNTPFFGPDYDSQAFFSSTQVNYNEIKQSHVQGVAGHVHHDSSDCAVSYTIAVNLSRLRPSTEPGYFWFPGLDLVVHLEPRSALIFQGIEEHTGTPVIPAIGDNSTLSHGDTVETRVNLIMYPNNSTLNDRSNWRRTGSEIYVAPRRPNLLQDALPCLGGVQNYALWQRMEAYRAIVNSLKDFEHLSLNPAGILQHVFSDSGNVIIDPAKVQALITKVGLFESEAESSQLVNLIQSLSSLIKSYVQHPFKDLVESPVDSNLTTGQKRTQELAHIWDLPHRAYIPTSGHVEEIAEWSDQLETSEIPFNFPELIQGDLDSEPLTQLEDFHSILGSNTDIQPQDMNNPSFTETLLFPTESAMVPADIPRAISTEPNVHSQQARENQLQRWFRNGIVLETLEQELQHVQRGHQTILEPLKVLSNSLGYCQQWKTLNPAEVLTNAIAHGRVLTGVLNLQDSIEDWSRILDAMFILTVINYIDGIKTRSELMDPWRHSFQPREDSTSFVQTLQDRIDLCLTQWQATPPEERHEFVITSSELFVKFKNNDQVLPTEVRLKAPRSFDNRTISNSNELRHLMFQTILYGLLIYHPFQRWTKRFTPRVGRFNAPVEKLVFKEQIPTLSNSTYHRQAIQLELYRVLLASIGKDMEPQEQPSLHVLRQPYDMVFGNGIPLLELRRWMPETLSTFLDENELALALPSIRASVQSLAKAWDQRLGFNKLITTRHAVRSLPPLLRQPNMAQNVSTRSVRPCATPRRKITFDPGRKLCFQPSDKMIPPACKSGWPNILFEYLWHAFKAAHLMVKLARKHRGNMHKLIADTQYTMLKSAQTCAFLHRGAMSALEGDRLIGLQTCGPSMTCFRQQWPQERAMKERRHFLHHLLVARVWAWGKLDAIQALQSLPPGPDPIESLFNRLGREHQARAKNPRGPLSYFCMLPAYGQSARTAAEFPSWMTKSWELAGLLASRFETNGTPPSFSAFKQFFLQEAKSQNMPYISATSLMTWLICCDMSEWQLILPPTSQDLANRLVNGGGQGPIAAFEQMAVEREVARIQWALQPIQTLLATVTPALAQALNKSCQEIQGRDFNNADVEHMLCKITREWKAVVPKNARDRDGYALPGNALDAVSDIVSIGSSHETDSSSEDEEQGHEKENEDRENEDAEHEIEESDKDNSEDEESEEE